MSRKRAGRTHHLPRARPSSWRHPTGGQAGTGPLRRAPAGCTPPAPVEQRTIGERTYCDLQRTTVSLLHAKGLDGDNKIRLMPNMLVPYSSRTARGSCQLPNSLHGCKPANHIKNTMDLTQQCGAAHLLLQGIPAVCSGGHLSRALLPQLAVQLLDGALELRLWHVGSPLQQLLSRFRDIVSKRY
jgi:hypothetical protein